MTISIMQNKFKNLIYSAGSILFWILLWYIAAIIANKNLLFPIPTPYDTLKELYANIRQYDFWSSVFASLWHILIGFIFGVIFGLICGMLSGNSKFFNKLSSPISRLIRSVPVAALIVIAWLWVPSDAMPSVIVFLMVLPIVWLQIETALLSIDNRLIEMAKVMGMDKRGILKHIKLPAVIPAFRISCITGLSFAWKSGVAAEVICNPTGSLGAMLSNAKSNIDYPKVFAIVTVIVILSVILENIIKFFWRERRYD